MSRPRAATTGLVRGRVRTEPPAAKKLMLFGFAHCRTPCPMCSALVGVEDHISILTVLPVPLPPRAPMGRKTGKPVCVDCATAEGLMSFVPALTFEMARIAVGNDRQELLRLPGVRMGLPMVRLSCEGDLARLHRWQDSVFGTGDQRDEVRRDRAIELGKLVAKKYPELRDCYVEVTAADRKREQRR